MLLLKDGGLAVHDYLYPRVSRASFAVLAMAQEIDATDTGVWFGCWRRGFPPIGFGFGEAPLEGWRMYQFHSAEKGNRLLNGAHISSYFTRSVVDNRITWLQQYGGGILLSCGIAFAPSGLAEHFDELLAVMVADELDLITKEEIRAIADISNNDHLRQHYAL